MPALILNTPCESPEYTAINSIVITASLLTVLQSGDGTLEDGTPRIRTTTFTGAVSKTFTRVAAAAYRGTSTAVPPNKFYSYVYCCTARNCPTLPNFALGATPGSIAATVYTWNDDTPTVTVPSHFGDDLAVQIACDYATDPITGDPVGGYNGLLRIANQIVQEIDGVAQWMTMIAPHELAGTHETSAGLSLPASAPYTSMTADYSVVLSP